MHTHWIAKIFVLLIVITGTFNFELEAKAETLPDISNHWARSDIETLLNAKIVEGRLTSDGKKLFFSRSKNYSS